MHERSPLTRRTLLAAGATGAAAALFGPGRRLFAEEAPARPKDEEGGVPRMPAAFVGHGSPMNAVDAERGAELRAWGRALADAKAVLAVSAHYEKRPFTIGATTRRPLLYDFRGFPRALYRIRYAPPPAPDLADRVERRLAGVSKVLRDPARGHDHGTWVPLRWMFPEADVPVLSVSLPGHDPRSLFRIGRALRPLRDEGVLILASGMLTHNLRHRPKPGDEAPTWSRAFDEWARRALEANDVDALLDWERKAPAARTNHPTVEHFVPLFLALGARRDEDGVRFPITGYEGGLSRRSVAWA